MDVKLKRKNTISHRHSFSVTWRRLYKSRFPLKEAVPNVFSQLALWWRTNLTQVLRSGECEGQGSTLHIFSSQSVILLGTPSISICYISSCLFIEVFLFLCLLSLSAKQICNHWLSGGGLITFRAAGFKAVIRFSWYQTSYLILSMLCIFFFSSNSQEMYSYLLSAHTLYIVVFTAQHFFITAVWIWLLLWYMWCDWSLLSHFY